MSTLPHFLNYPHGLIGWQYKLPQFIGSGIERVRFIFITWIKVCQIKNTTQDTNSKVSYTTVKLNMKGPIHLCLYDPRRQ